MPKFTDSPYFLLDDYFKAIDISDVLVKEDVSYTWVVPFTSIIIEDGVYTLQETSTPIGDLDGVDGNLFACWCINPWNINYSYSPSTISADGTYLTGPKINIITAGGGLHDMYVKDQEQGFIPITVKHIDTSGNDFNFWNHGPNIYNPGDTIIDTLLGTHYRFDEYNKTLRYTFNEVDNGLEVYFRKDSLYHDWVKDGATDYYSSVWEEDLTIRNYMNYDVQFSYFGDIYKTRDGEYCTISFNGMKDYVVDAIPFHQRTTNFVEFLNVFFDKSYQENYNLLKNLFTMLDPFEIDIKYLGYLSKYFDMFDVPITSSNLKSREFIAYMPWLLKRKGTYPELYIIWRVLAATTNRLNVYEIWHDKDITGTVPVSAYEEYIYTDKPEYEFIQPTDGAGQGWYQDMYPCTLDTYTSENKILSTHYRVELDINNEPLEYEEILTKELWDSLYKYWEYLRPINRVSDYRILFSPRTNFSGFNFSLYDRSTRAYCNSVSSDYSLWEQGAYIKTNVTEASDTWVFSHNLNSQNILTQVIDENMNGIVPASVEMVDNNNIVISFSEPVLGYALCKKADGSRSSGGAAQWTITHLRDKKEVLIQYRLGNDKVFSDETVLIDKDTAEATTTSDANVAMISDGDFVAIQSLPDTIWTLPHTLNKKGVIVSVYDNTDTQIQPISYQLVSNGEIEIVFDDAVSGYVVMSNVGNLSFDDIIGDFETNIQTATWKLGESIGDIDSDNVLSEGSVNSIYSDDEYYYFDVVLPKEEESIFNEIFIYGHDGSKLFSTDCSNVYKPDGIDLTIHYRVLKSFDNE